jgi:hypothetical protein
MEYLANIITEGENDATMLRQLLPDLTSTPDAFRIIVGGGYSSALAAAHTILTTTNKPALLVIDADTTDSRMAYERKRFVEEYVNGTAHAICTVIVAIPTLEVLFFADKATLEEALGKKISDDLWELAQLSPKKALDLITGDYQITFRKLLVNKNIRLSIGKTPIMNEIRTFLQAA